MRPPVTRAGTGYVLHLGREERALIARLLDELRALITEPSGAPLVRRLFPVVHPDNPEREAEYQRLMRDELVTSRLAGIDAITEVLGRPGRKVTLEESEMVAFMQAVNSVRLVLGTLLDITEDDDVGVADESGEDPRSIPEYQLYGYLSWVLDSSVRAVSGHSDLP